MSVKVILNNCRFSYVNVFQPRASQPGDEAKYSVTLLIPKTATDDVEAIKRAIVQARDEYRAKNGPASLPDRPNTTLHDGDGVKDSGEPYGDECKGHYVISVSSKQAPGVIGTDGRALSEGDLYSGCYGKASISFYGYSRSGKKGISAGLNNLMKTADGEPLGGGRASAADDFGVQADADGWL